MTVASLIYVEYGLIVYKFVFVLHELSSVLTTLGLNKFQKYKYLFTNLRF